MEMKKVNRRDFLKKTALGAAALGMGGLMGKTVTGESKPPIKIGVAISLTGSMAREGELDVGGDKLWRKIINEIGSTFGEVKKLGCPGPGLLGRPVEFIVYDDKSDPSEAVKLVRRLVVSDKVDLILGPYGSGASNAIAPLSEEYQIPIITPLANAPVIWEGKKREWFVGILPPAWKNLYGSLMIGKEKGARTAAFIYSDTAFPLGATRPLMRCRNCLGSSWDLLSLILPNHLKAMPPLSRGKPFGNPSRRHRGTRI